MKNIKLNSKKYTREEIEHARNVLFNFFCDVLKELEAENADKEELEKVQREIEILKSI